MFNLTVVQPDELVLQFEVGQGLPGPPGGAWAPSSIAECTYDSGGRLLSYQADGDAYTVAYPDADHIVITGGGKTKTVTLADGLIDSIVTT